MVATRHFEVHTWHSSLSNVDNDFYGCDLVVADEVSHQVAPFGFKLVKNFGVLVLWNEPGFLNSIPLSGHLRLFPNFA